MKPCPAAIQRLRQRIELGELCQGSGNCEQLDIAQACIDRITRDVKPARPMKLSVDSGNGVAGAYAGRLPARWAAKSRSCMAKWAATSPTIARPLPCLKTWKT